MELEDMIEAFDSAAGLEHVPAAEGVWKYSADGHVFGVTADEPGKMVFVFGEVPAPPPDREEPFRKAVLEANFFGRGTGGAVFSVNPDTGAYTLIQSERLDHLEPKSFFALVERFVNTLATWKGIAEAVQAEAPDSAPDKPADNGDAMSLGFMRI